MHYQSANVHQVYGWITVLRPYILFKHCQIGIRGTGHTPISASANMKNGISIDMRDNKSITLSDDRLMVDIGISEMWATVYAELEMYSLTDWHMFIAMY